MKRFVALAFALGVLGSLGAGNASAASSRSLPAITSPGGSTGAPVHLRGRFAPPSTHVSTAAALRQATAATTVPMWHRTATDGVTGTTYPYAMIGRSPFVAQTTTTTKIPVELVPVTFVFNSFSNATFDPTASNSCDPAGTSDLARLENSPIFRAANWSFGGTSSGPASQYVDAFQRAEFWAKTKPGSINPNYNVNLASPNSHVIPVNVPVNGGDVVTGACGNIGLLDYSTWDSYVQNTLFPFLANQTPAVGPSSMVIFLFHNAALYNGNTSNCCILGYHSAFNNPGFGGAVQTYANADYDTDRSFTGVEDVGPMSHEIAEWMDDPLGNNATPSWGNIGQVSGCQSNLEVGDPLSGTTLRSFLNGYTYHPQELAFFSWFYHQKPSLGINGWYSNNDTLESSAASC